MDTYTRFQVNLRKMLPLALGTSLLAFGVSPAAAATPTSTSTTTTATVVAESVRPGPTNTGDLSGVPRHVHNGDLVITTPGTVIDHMEIRGFVTIKAPNVVIKNSVITGRPITSGSRALVMSNIVGGANLLIKDSELYASTPNPYTNGVMGNNFVLERVNIHSVVDTAHIYDQGGNVIIRDSWLHDTSHFVNDPNWGGKPSHDDIIQIQNGANISIVNNTMEGVIGGAGIQFTQDRGPIGSVRVDGNFINGGGCSVNIAEGGKGPLQEVVIINNVFGRDTRHLNCAVIAPSTTHPYLKLSNNFYVDGAAVKVRRG